jgi:predicted metal-dependent hydrolase
VFIFGHLSVFGYTIICIFGRYFVHLSVYSSGGFIALENVLEDKELGRLLIRVNVRARRLTFRTREDAIYVTVPPGTTLTEVKNAIEELRPRLRVARQKYTRPLIDLNYRIDTEFFKLSLVSGQRERFLSRSELGEMQIICPPDADFTDPALQAWLRKVIEEALRRNAKIILPPRLYMLSQKHNLPYQCVKINSSNGRWGSCSARRNINLSYYLMLLPKHLIDYVLLHELTHTREMNHGERFWALLDELTEGKSQLLRKELRQYRTDF